VQVSRSHFEPACMTFSEFGQVCDFQPDVSFVLTHVVRPCELWIRLPVESMSQLLSLISNSISCLLQSDSTESHSFSVLRLEDYPVEKMVVLLDSDSSQKSSLIDATFRFSGRFEFFRLSERLSTLVCI
jgi:hypothetical protein